jgi:hypothetical protein
MVEVNLNPPHEFERGRYGAVDQGGIAHARDLWNGANAADDYGARATEDETQRWERLAAAARADRASRGTT